MSLLRAFIAVEIPLAIRQGVCEETSHLRREIGPLVRWVPLENMYLTLKFLGDISPSSVEILSQMLSRQAEPIEPFDMSLGGLGAFPSLKRPRVLYIGIQAPAALEALQRGIESAARRLGYESEERDFSPHLTLGRLKQGISGNDQQRIRSLLEATTIDSLGTAGVHSVHLYRSELKPAGSVYTRLFSAPLKKR